jgi:hypothetical protein
MHAYRQPFKLFVIGLVGILLIIAAMDIMFFHWISTVPEGAPDALSTRGRAQQRGDVIWGAALIGMGVLLIGTSLIELFRRQPIVDVRDDGLFAQIGAQQPDVLIPWSQIAYVTSGVETDEFDGSVREQLVIAIKDPAAIPAEIAGAEWVGSELHIDAHDWTRGVTEIALAAQGARDHAMRPNTPPPQTAPAMMWETSVDIPDAADAPEFREEEEEE